MDFSVKSKSMPPAVTPCSHRPFSLYCRNRNKDHHHLEVSPHCPLHGGFLLQPNSNHHYHLEPSPDCPIHSFLLPICPLQTSKSHSNTPNSNIPNSASQIPSPQNPQFSNPNSINSYSLPAEPDKFSQYEALMIQERDEEAEEEEITFVLTDEWKEFFAKSEAKRRLAKKQAKKGKH